MKTSQVVFFRMISSQTRNSKKNLKKASKLTLALNQEYAHEQDNILPALEEDIHRNKSKHFFTILNSH